MISRLAATVALLFAASGAAAAPVDSPPGKPADTAGTLERMVGPVRDDLAIVLDRAKPPITHGIGTVEALIGDAYYYGHWVTRDYAEAGLWYRRAAADGNALAESTLGDMYYYGRDVPQDFTGAVTWWQRAADRGVAIAQLNLSVMYANGDGVEQDYVRSHLYANLAAAHLPPGEDHDIAVKNRAIIAKTLTPAQLAEAQRLARDWHPKQAD
jgi:uncharacterized protein